jgi:hypothetical protein
VTLAAVALAAVTSVAGEAPAVTLAAVAAAAAAQGQRPRWRRRQRFQTENDVAIVPIFQSLEALLAKKSIQKKKKAEKVNFYLRHKNCNIANLAPIFSDAGSGTIANKNQKTITAGTHSEMSRLTILGGGEGLTQSWL